MPSNSQQDPDISEHENRQETSHVPPTTTAEKNTKKRSFKPDKTSDIGRPVKRIQRTESTMVGGSTAENAIDVDAWDAGKKKIRIRVEGTCGKSPNNPIDVDVSSAAQWGKIIRSAAEGKTKQKVKKKQNSIKKGKGGRDFWFGTSKNTDQLLSDASLIVVEEWKREFELTSQIDAVGTDAPRVPSLEKTSPDPALHSPDNVGGPPFPATSSRSGPSSLEAIENPSEASQRSAQRPETERSSKPNIVRNLDLRTREEVRGR